MDFGMGSYDDLNRDDFILKPQGRFYFDEKLVKPNYYIGLPKWSDMLKIINEKKERKKLIREKDCLKEYAQRFNAIELNATHYKIYDPTGIKRWVEDVQGRDFIFCPKMHKGITHFGSLNRKDVILDEFFNSITQLGPHLGPVFILLGHNFSLFRKDELYQFLRALPLDKIRFFLEIRNGEWYESDTLQDDLNKTLHELGIGRIILDTPLIRTGVQFNFPIPAAFIRFVCKGNNEIDFYRIKQWKSQLAYLANHGVKDIYFFLDIHDKNKMEDFYKYVQSEFMPQQSLPV